MRRSGILFPISSLPSRFGIGGMGASARDFADILAAAGQSVWQVLPLTVPDYVHSPYASPSAFAGSPELIDPAELVEDGLLRAGEVRALAGTPPSVADYARAAAVKQELLHTAYARFTRGFGGALHAEYASFCAQMRFWLPDYALFSAIRQARGNAPLWEWESALARREDRALAQAAAQYEGEIHFCCFVQFIFHRQLSALRAYLGERGISLLGDIPFYVAADSADVWAQPELFSDSEVAGVPPDFFSEDGQLWGNPLYRFDRMAEDGYDWWMRRLARCGEMYDEVRIDHFRALDSYYAIPKGTPDAKTGEWRRGPGQPFVDLVRARMPELSLIAEDLGDITKSVTELRQYAGIPGMRVMQFAFDGDARNPFLPHNYERNTVCYLGTHDNDTTAGWWESAAPETRRAAAAYLGIKGSADARTATRAMMRQASASIADTVIFTVQDICATGSETRINTPAKVGGCWEYALPSLPSASRFDLLTEMTVLYGRVAERKKTKENTK